ncbi:MAG TPA: alpha/beta hydrolase [Hyphomicrobiaceae bacterium]|nr:alpha/beta hydrolase [Hyphomicrobiaceae bacterium]
MAYAINVMAGAAVLYGGIVLAAWLGQRKLMYHPNTTRTAPAAVGLVGVEERLVETDDGARIVTWQVKAEPGRPTILYFHGNAGDLADRAERIRQFSAAGWGAVMMAYRGYAGSTGSPSEAANVADAKRVFDRLVAEGTRAESIIAYGESLGSGVAVQLAASRPVRALVLDAPYTSIVDVAASVYPYLPVRPLLKDRYESSRHLGVIKVPVLILHGERDQVIPIAMGRAMYALANEPKRMVEFPAGNHSDLFSHGALEAIRRWLGEVGAAEPAR